MVQSTPLSSLGRLVSLAYAGTDMPVHLVCESPAGDLVKWALDYPQFQRILRERANRADAITLLSAFRNCSLADPASGLRRWNLLDVVRILGCGLALDAPFPAMSPPLQHAA